jgi:outer membrane protease
VEFVAISLLIATPVFAADQSLPPLQPLATKSAPMPDINYFTPHPIPSWQVEFAARFWYGSAKTGKSLYDPSLSNGMISRLTYGGLNSYSGELYGRVTLWNGWFAKGYFGGGGLAGGHLQDEDFPPVLGSYSSTTSDQHGGHLAYGSFDAGYDVVRGGNFRIGAFAGYHYFNEAVNAYGCTQSTGNPFICPPGAVSASTEAISQNNTWQSVRLGLDGAVTLGHFTLSAEGAWLPYVNLSGADTHYLRIGNAFGDFTGPIPENGIGQGYQLEALLSYNVTRNASVGIGGRYWHMQTNGSSNESFVGEGTVSLPENWKTDIYGVFVQGSIKLDPYPLWPRPI